MAERQVDDVDAEHVLVGNRELDRTNDVACLAGAGAVEDLQSDKLHARSHALEFRVFAGLQATDQAGNVRAVAVVVVRPRPHCAAGGEVVERLDAMTESGGRKDAGIDHRHGDTVAAGGEGRQAKRSEQGVNRRRRVCRPRCPGTRSNAAARRHVGVLRARLRNGVEADRLELGGGQLDSHRIDTRQLRVDTLAARVQ